VPAERGRRGRDHRQAGSGGHQAQHGLDEPHAALGDPGRDPGVGEQRGDGRVQPGHVVPFREDEGLLRDVGEGDRARRRCGVRLGEGEEELLGGEPALVEVRVGDRQVEHGQVEAAVVQGPQQRVRGHLAQGQLGGFYTRTGWGTALGEGREERTIRGEPHIYQESLRADVALVRARAADELGNLVYSKTARNFNPDMATAADLVIAEVDEVVPVGALDPEAIVTPHLFVDAVVLSGAAR
jgi:Coenzyme A transferase